MRNNVVVAALSAVIFGAAGYATAADLTDTGDTFHGCVNKYSGALRVVAPDKDCRRSENPVTWNQTGPAGPKGDTGAAGPASIDALDGSACTRADGSAGVLAVAVGSDNAVSMVCGVKSTWCSTHTPEDDIFLHQRVTCDEETRTLTYTCEDGWVDANHEHADGCEASTSPPAAISFDQHAVAYLAVLIPSRPKSSVDIQPDCDSAPAVACTGGSPDTSLSSVSVDTSQLAGDPPRAQIDTDADARTFTVTERARLTTDEPIPVTFSSGGFSGECSVSIDSRRGPSPDVTMTYTDRVEPDAPNGPTVVSTPSTLTGLTADDIDISGGFLCTAGTLAGELSGLYDGIAHSLGPWVVQGATVCGVAEPVYFERCSP